MRQVLYVAAAILLFGLVLQPVSAQIITESQVVRGIAVSGTAEVRVAPDIAYVTLGVRTRAAQANQAVERNTTAMQQVTQALRRLTIPEADIQTVQFSLQPVFEYPREGTPRLTGYEATNLVRVTVRDLTRVGAVIDAAVQAGANVVQDVAFALRDEAEVRATALTRAIQDARSKAQVMARALNVNLGRVINATETTAPIVFPLVARAEAGAGGVPPISPGQIEVQATVNVVYAIGS
ncbi:MAG TPA: SIMPL domain-containing protein [Armatimonadota bacterium]|nr:SIMPL domain-containing protein [Armatimonadota bacterium]